MPISERSVSLLAVLVTILALGCGSSTPDAEEPPPARTDADPIAILPEGAYAIVRVDVARLRASPYWATFRSWLDQIDAVDEGGALGVMIEPTEVAVLAAYPGDGGAIVVLRGTFAEGLLDRAVRESGTPGLVPAQIAGRRGYRDDEHCLVEVSRRTWLIGAEPLVTDAIGRVERRAAAALGPEMVLAMQTVVASAAIGAAVRVTPELARESREEELVSKITWGSVRVDVSAGIRIAATAEAATAADAELLAEAGRTTVLRAAASPAMVMFGLAGVLESVEIRASGRRVDGTLFIDHETTAGLLDRVSGFVGFALAAMASGGGGGDGGDDVPVEEPQMPPSPP